MFNIYNQFYIPVTKMELIEFILAKLNFNKTDLLRMERKQLMAIYYRIRNKENNFTVDNARM